MYLLSVIWASALCRANLNAKIRKGNESIQGGNNGLLPEHTSLPSGASGESGHFLRGYYFSGSNHPTLLDRSVNQSAHSSQVLWSS